MICHEDAWDPGYGATKLAAEPNPGQLDPLSENVYDVLEKIYKDMLKAFSLGGRQMPNLFHMGGDEVNFQCWSKSKKIREWMRKEGYPADPHQGREGYLELWNLFQEKAMERLKKAKREVATNSSNSDFKHGLVMWTSDLAKPEVVDKYLPKSDYTIQVWCDGDDDWVARLMQMGYQLIMSNSDAWYLDCGFGAWTWDGRGPDNNWCSPFKSWKTMYENSPRQMARRFGYQWEGEIKNQVMGGEAAMWSEQVGLSMRLV